VMDRKGRGAERGTGGPDLNVRRTFIFLERSFEAGPGSTVFEPNDGPPWAGVRVTERLPAYRDWNPSRTCRLPLRCDPMTMKHEDLDRAHPPSHDRLRSGEVGWGRRRARRTHRA
jgi:hypothetical protein